MLHHFKPSEDLLSHYARLLCDTVIPFQEDVLNDRIAGVAPSHAIENFERAAALLEGDESMRGTFYGMSFQDSDVGKWIEAAAYSLLIKPDPALEKRLDALCDVIAWAQEPDGYLNTYFTLTCPDRKFANLLEGCELYCAGHLMEGAAALYANLFASGELTLPEVSLTTETAYPFGDTVTYTVRSGQTRLAIHIPAFTAGNFSVSMPGEYRDGYYYLDVRAGDVIRLQLDMTPRVNRTNIRAARNSGLAAVTVGPVVYCAEGADNDGEVFSFSLHKDGLERQMETPAQIGGLPREADAIGAMYTVTARGTSLRPEDPDALYFFDEYREEPRTLKLIPYFLWGNRGLNQMRIWFPVR